MGGGNTGDTGWWWWVVAVIVGGDIGAKWGLGPVLAQGSVGDGDMAPTS